MNCNDLKYWIALKSIPGIGNSTFCSLEENFGSVAAVFSAPIAELSALPGINKKIAVAITGFKNWDPIHQELAKIEKSAIRIITYRDDLYPSNLLNIYDRPAFLYTQGLLKKDDINIAIVGSRQASTYGKYTTERISRELALKGVTIVSGLARGIDSCAHRGALSAQGRTIAVLGSGLDVFYPPENKNLFAEIVQNGAVISEFPLGTQPLAYNFPSRNRIISGMSYGVVVVEAGEKSGSLITARLALEQGREVFAVPGTIDSAGARGTHKLIKQGAKLIENIDDILEEILPQVERSATMPSTQKQDFIPACVSRTTPEKNTVALTPIDQAIVKILSQGNLHADDIITAAGLTPANVLSTLITLELKGIVLQHPGKYFSLKEPRL